MPANGNDFTFCHEQVLVVRGLPVAVLLGYATGQWLTLALFDPSSDGGPVYSFGRFAPTDDSRRFLCDVIRRFNEMDESAGIDSGLLLGVFAE